MPIYDKNQSDQKQRRGWYRIFGITLCVGLLVGIGSALAQSGYYSVYWQPEEFGSPTNQNWQTRLVYPYSIVAGGTIDAEEVVEAMHNDLVVREHYRGTRFSALVPVRLTEPMSVHVSYRKGDKIYWTARKVNIPRGELVLSDGATLIRARCGNRLAARLTGVEVMSGGPSDLVVAEALEDAIPEIARIPSDTPSLGPRPRTHSDPPGIGEEQDLALTPEPATWLLYLSGFVIVMYLTGRRRNLLGNRNGASTLELSDSASFGSPKGDL